MANDHNDEYRSGFRDSDRSRNYEPSRGQSYASPRDYGSGRSAGDDRNFRGGGTGYGDRDYRPSNEGGRESFGGRDYYGGRSEGRSDPGYGTSNHGRNDFGREYGRSRDQHRGDRDRHERSHGRDRHSDRGAAGKPQDYDYEDRGFLARAGDEVRSWFGDDEAERRREYDQRFDERLGDDRSFGRDADYRSWRKSQIDALDRDYRDYRRENAQRFESEFASWRSHRQTQRDLLGKVSKDMDVIGSDGALVGTVDHVSGDRILLNKTDADAGGERAISCGWLQSVDDKVTLTKSAEEAKTQLRDDKAKSALFGGKDRAEGDDEGKVDLNRSFSGTY